LIGETGDRRTAAGAGGNTDAFQILYERYRDPIFRFAYRLLGSVEAAEDVAHDCFLSLIKAPGRFDASRASLRTYLYAAARNLAATRYNSFAREAAIEEMPDAFHTAERHSPVARVLENELSGEVERAVAGLPPLQREALVLFEYEELSLAEVAAVVGADANAVKARLFRAREKLRARLGRYLEIGREPVSARG
jgi:RNA polymerase sigma-70 factor, ECF subfamily